jgi:flagellar biosynthesis GTPase FlhF
MASAPTEKLSYRELGARLGISPDGARMKAKRKVAAGRWRIIPGNHPSDQVLVELPADDLVRSVGWERSAQPSPEQSPRTPQPEQANATTDRALAALSEAVGLLRPAQEQIERLHGQLMEAKAAHHRDAMELVAAEMREMGTKAELERALADVAALKHQIVSWQQHQRPWWRRL